jgi:AcrR family transcriptional regulator
MTPRQTPRDVARSSARPRRADAERNVERIVEAGLEALASDPEASMADIARRAGVARATVYVHFPTRETLIEAVTRRAIADVTKAMKSAEPDRDDPSEALQRVLRVAWRELGRFHALVGINVQQPQADLMKLHGPVFAVLQPLIERGQHDDSFRPDVPATWHISMLLALIHAASIELQNNVMPMEQIESALLATALGAVVARPEQGVTWAEDRP